MENSGRKDYAEMRAIIVIEKEGGGVLPLIVWAQTHSVVGHKVNGMISGQLKQAVHSILRAISVPSCELVNVVVNVRATVVYPEVGHELRNVHKNLLA